MDANTAADVVLAVVATAGLLAACVRWFYKRGSEERAAALTVTATQEVARVAAVTARAADDASKLAQDTARAIATSMDLNTLATRELSSQIASLRETLGNHDSQLLEHSYRIRQLERDGHSHEKDNP